jgi:uncharacterized membrane protein YagU involved in acid resistance
MKDREIGQLTLKKMWSVILLAGFLVGTLDILLALIIAYAKNGVTPDKVLRYISSGAFGKLAYSGGGKMILAGLFFHYLIANSFTVLFFSLYEKMNFRSVNKILLGILVGIAVWVVMNLLVLPLSKIPSRPLELKGMLQSAGILIIAIGVPLSYIAASYFKPKKEMKEVVI